MFHTNLSSERRKLFLWILLSFLIVGFGTKYILAQFNRVHPQQTATHAVPNLTAATDVTDNSDLLYTVSQIEQVEQVVTKFIQIYVSNDPTQREQRLVPLKRRVTKEFYAILQAEEQARPIQEASFLKAQQIQQVSCEQAGIKLKCLVITEWNDPENRRVEQVYECGLIHLKQEWLIEEVDIRGNLD